MKTLRYGMIIGAAAVLLGLNGPGCSTSERGSKGGSGGDNGSQGGGAGDSSSGGSHQGGSGSGGSGSGGSGSGGSGSGGSASGGATNMGGGSGGMRMGGMNMGGMNMGGMNMGGCPAVAPAARAGAIWDIVKINFATKAVTLRNVSAQSQNTTTPVLVACARPNYNATFGSGGGAVAAGADITINAGATLTLAAAGGDLAIYVSTNYATTADMRSYVRWGTVPATNRTTEAVAAALWTANTQVSGSANMGGLIAVGNTTTAAGYMAVPANCVQ